MTITEESIMCIREEYPDLDDVVRNFLWARGEEGGTIAEIKDKYCAKVGGGFPISGDGNDITCYLLSIPGVSAFCDPQGTRIFTIKSVTSQPRNLRQSKRTRSGNNNERLRPCIRPSQRNTDFQPQVRSRFTRPTQLRAFNGNEGLKGQTGVNNDCIYFANGNQVLAELNENAVRQTFSSSGTRRQSHRSRRTRSSGTTSTRTSRPGDSAYLPYDSDKAQLWDFLLLGDDLFLHLAHKELKCKITTRNGVLQSGLCVSGQTISDAIRRVRQMNDYRQPTGVVVNIGSIDIILGKPLVQIQHKFRELINLMFRKGMIPILTTLAPLANFSHVPEITYKLEQLNSYIKRLGRNLQVIDIWSYMEREGGRPFFECYVKEPRPVPGTAVSVVHWNCIGRKRILQLIETSVEY